MLVLTVTQTAGSCAGELGWLVLNCLLDLHQADLAGPALRELGEQVLDPLITGTLGGIAVLQPQQELGQPRLGPGVQSQV